MGALERQAPFSGAARLNDSTDVHVHLAETARLKNGSSAGVTLAVALLSALTGQVARVDVAMSGELTLRAHDRVGGRHCGEVAGSMPSADDHDAPSGNEAHVAESFGDELPGGIREPARPGASRPALAGGNGN